MTAKSTPRIDIVFKKNFGGEENKDLLNALISVISTGDQAFERTLLNPYTPQNFSHDKLAILDIETKSHRKERYNIEIQVSDEANYAKRNFYLLG